MAQENINPPTLEGDNEGLLLKRWSNFKDCVTTK